MKEIDFLPKWYKSRKRWQSSYRMQYIVLSVIFAMMVVWDFVAAGSISSLTKEMSADGPKQARAENMSRQFAKVEREVMELREKAKTIDEIIPRSSLKVAKVLSELSYLIDERIVLSGIDFTSEGVGSKKKSNQGMQSVNKSNFIPLGDNKFRLEIKAVAADAADIAELICRLEDSVYFSQICPSISRNRVLPSSASSGEKRDVTEFTISCYLANFSEAVSSFAKDVSVDGEGDGL
jgi:hypothetical protein